jgi:hypothetical protein
LDPFTFEEAQNIRDFELPAQYGAIPVRGIFPARASGGVCAIPDLEPEGHVGSNHFPHRLGCAQLLFQPRDLFHTYRDATARCGV